MALSVYESNTNQRFVTSLIKQDGDVSATVSVNCTVLGFLSSPYEIEWFSALLPIGCPSVLLKLLSRLERELCWRK